MTTEFMSEKWVNFRCFACEKPIRVELGYWEKVVCSCGCLHEKAVLQEKLNEDENVLMT